MKEKFYIYLDIDGVLNNRNWFLFFKEKKLNENIFSKRIDPNCMEALNFLIDKLETKYDPYIIFSSIEKEDVGKIVRELKKCGIHYDKPFNVTKKRPDNNRGMEILETEIQHGFRYFVVIDDQNMDEILSHCKIETNPNFAGLTKASVSSFLQFGLEM